MMGVSRLYPTGLLFYCSLRRLLKRIKGYDHVYQVPRASVECVWLKEGVLRGSVFQDVCFEGIN